jgi:hypothetical protein
MDVPRLVDADAARTLVGIRCAYWAGAALTLLWAPLRGAGIPPFRAFEARTDLLFGTFAQWDAVWFLNIAKHGYDTFQATAYLPLYPLLVRAAGFVIGSQLVAAVLVSLIAAAAGVSVVAAIARPMLGIQGARDTVLLLALYPVAFVFTAPLSDGLFLALSAGSFLAALRSRPWLAGILGAAAVSTRLVGLALAPALLLLLWPRSRRELPRLGAVLLVPAGIVPYLLFLKHRFGDAFAFKHAQETFWHREPPPLGWFGGLWGALSKGVAGAVHLATDLPRMSASGFGVEEQLAIYNVVHLALLVAALALTWVAWRRFGPAFGAFALMSTVLPLESVVSAFPLTSFPRYALTNFPLFLALASVLQNRPRLRQAVLIGFAATGAAAAVAFSHNIWVA